MKKAVVLFNLGGPSSYEAIKPFLRNLFSDPAIIDLPTVLRKPLAYFIACRREAKAREIYSCWGGKSPLYQNTQRQAELLEQELGPNYRVYVCMRYWHPRAQEVIREIEKYAPEEIVLLPLYPQFSTTTTASSFREFQSVKQLFLPEVRCKYVESYPQDQGFVTALSELVSQALKEVTIPYRILFTAHGLPMKIIRKGDPYENHIIATVNAVVSKLAMPAIDYQICYQSRVGLLEWLKPYTEEEIIRAGHEKKSVIMVPVSFVSENSETLFELDVQYKNLALQQGIPEYIRVPTVSEHPLFIKGLADLVRQQHNRENEWKY